MQYEVAIVGGGVAGLQAALVLVRSRRSVVVIDGGEPRNAPSAHSHGFLSRDGFSPRELLEGGRAEVRTYADVLREDSVFDIEQRGPQEFVLHCAEGSQVSAKTVLITTGLCDELPNIPGVAERFGDDVLHCPYCHGYEVADQPLAVVGGENRPMSLHQAGLLRQWSRDIVFFPNTLVLTGEEKERLTAFGVRILEGTVACIVVTDGRVTGVELADGTVTPRSVIFVGPRFTATDELLTKLGCAVGDEGWVKVDPAGGTSVLGVWAAGNVVDPTAQLVNAAGAGYKAAVAINHYLLAAEMEQALVEQGERES